MLEHGNISFENHLEVYPPDLTLESTVILQVHFLS